MAQKLEFRLAEIYPVFQGEVNFEGIGAPAIFVRLAGCHLRCYKKTLGVLCDTPQFLERKTGEIVTPAEIIERCKVLKDYSGINSITLTGGDPLFNDQDTLAELLGGLVNSGFSVSVETSGVDYSIAPYAHIYGVYWVLDWKTPSAGISNLEKRRTVRDDLLRTKPGDFVKFVVHGEEDYQHTIEAVQEIHPLAQRKGCKIAVGAYWGGPITTQDLFNRLARDKMFDKVTLNFQAHKALYSANFSVPTEGVQL